MERTRSFSGDERGLALTSYKFYADSSAWKPLKRYPFWRCLLEPSQRARQTAEGIVQQWQNSVPIYYDSNLREMGYGKLEGKSIAEMHARYGETLNNMRHHLDLYDPTVFNGETVTAMLKRMTKTIAEAANQYNDPILFVGHGASMTAAVQFLAGKDTPDLRNMGGLKNNSLSILKTKDKKIPYKLTLWNDVSFLP